jgi:tetratricopeptide (TPR) repeat protein
MSNNTEAYHYYNLGLNDFNEKKYEKALKLFQKAVKIEENFAFAWDNIGVCNRFLGNFDEAIAAYEKSIAIDPKGKMPLQNIAVVFIYKKEYNKAILAYEKLAKLDAENAEVFYGIGQVCFQYTKENEKALRNMCQAYNLYVQQKSPYRTDAEKIISMIFAEYKKENKEKEFYDILKEYKLNPQK